MMFAYSKGCYIPEWYEVFMSATDS